MIYGPETIFHDMGPLTLVRLLLQRVLNDYYAKSSVLSPCVFLFCFSQWKICHRWHPPPPLSRIFHNFFFNPSLGYWHIWLHLWFEDKLKIGQASACKMEPQIGIAKLSPSPSSSFAGLRWVSFPIPTVHPPIHPPGKVYFAKLSRNSIISSSEQMVTVNYLGIRTST